MRLQRHPSNPVLLPDPASDWECYNVFNPGVVYDDGLFHMFYRAQGLDYVSASATPSAATASTSTACVTPSSPRRTNGRLAALRTRGSPT